MISKKIKNKEEHQDDFIEISAVDSKAVMEGEENQVIHEKKHRTKKRKLELNEDEKKSQEAGKKHKKIKVSDKIEANKNGEDNLVHGKRFSKEEDKILEKAISNNIELHGLGKDGLNMILNCQSHPEVRNCWKEMGAALPWRPTSSVYYQAHILFERDEKHKWSAEEYEMIRKYVEEHGTKWKTLAKATEEKKSKHGMLRDNICWEAISEKLSTRTFSACCSKWYCQLASHMVAEGKWADADDYRLLDALSSLDACCMEDVDWDNLLEHRSGDTYRKRCSQMVQHIGHHGSQSFPEQVEILASRFHPDVLKARETLDNKPDAHQP
ncbi:hypothetical protein SLEP1_g19983 [Rubroshorea leprosula]|uniref:Myb-like domain-containing protein n=1 Tax=Rubroshorea leprosula TaxID=152421 RepID=A0AAV5J764_9ROSI|nr:hypothetical protein SLEP1_g19983 [Rubroshorea leprosula]